MPMTDQVWIVDDDSSIRWVMEKALSRAGVNCRAFETGDEVLDALAEEEPLVVVSDIRMPGMDGIALLSKLKSQQPDLPVIITTAHSDLDSAVSSYEEGAFEYLPKPFDIEEMGATAESDLKAMGNRFISIVAPHKPPASKNPSSKKKSKQETVSKSDQ